MVKNINELISIRKNWIIANRENNFEDGIKNLLSNMYPDEAHFIYELLQNAEDKKAKHVYFKMTKDELIFEHDGGLYDKAQLFTLKDIESITGIGTSTKKDDNTAIGKFGIGFKAVFAYTETPQIFSGDYSFEINDLVVPRLIECQLNLKEGITRFVFPFNSKTKNIKDTLFEIRKGLINIKDNTLLFLKNIESISYELDDLRKGEFLRIDEKDNQVTLLGKSNEETHWLRFDKQIKVEDEEDSKIKSCTINIAFKLNESSNGCKEIIPTDSGVSIFFPAEKEVSNLKFIINAPFASTIARDSVRNCKSNKLLINELSLFIKEVLQKIADYGYMCMNFFKVLPNDSDDIPEIYRPIFESIYEEYESKPYFITQTNELDYLKNVVKAYRAVVYELFSDENINEILNKKDLKWLKNPSLDNSPESRFLNMFPIKQLRVYDLLSKKNTYLLEIIETKDNKWFYKLFKQLFKECSDFEDINVYNLSDFPFIPTLSNGLCLPRDVYYSRQEFESVSSNIISNEVFTNKTKDDNKIRIDEDVIRILEKLGVKEFDSKAKIEIILNKYKDTKNITDEQNILDIRELIELSYNYLNHNSNYWGKKDVIGLIKNTKCMQGKNGHYYSLNNMILGKPYKESFYELLKEKVNIGKEIISEKYDVSEDKFFKNKIIYVCKELNVLTDLEICEDYGGGPIGKDYYIPLLQEALNAKDIVISVYIWNFLANINIAYYSKHKELGCIYDSNFVSKLRDNLWLPDIKNNFCKPCDIYVEDLPKEFTKKNILDLVNVLNIKSRSESNKKLEEDLLDNNIDSLSVSDIAKMNEIAKVDPQAIFEFIQKHDPFNEERRTNKNIEDAKNSKEISYETKEYSHRKSETIIDAKPYLKNLYYMSDRDYMVCQICKKNMPFKTKKGFWYFEDIEMFKSDLVCKANESTHICLCPTCSAKYKEYIKNNEAQQLEIINEILYKKRKDINSIDIKMDKEYSISFKNKHYFDLKIKLPQLLNNEIKENLDNDQKMKMQQGILNKETVHDGFINAEWTEINNQDILRIGYCGLSYIMFVDYKTGVEYFEKITKEIFNKLSKDINNIEENITNLKDSHFVAIYKIK